jgi:NAD(P)-dependent dehydrogenase (short-subunit alcohol dehydrogenase family)
MVGLVRKQFNENSKVAVVTGSSSGIGLAIVERYLREGYRVFSISRRLVKPLSEKHFHLTADLSNWSNNIDAAELIVNQVNQVDVLINNVGKSEWKSLEKIDEPFIDEIFNLNVKSYFAMTKGLLKIIPSGATIINISSMAGKRGSANNSTYSASKFAVNGFTQSLAKELGPRGIRVNALCPVLIKSGGLEDALTKIDAPAEKIGVNEFLNQFFFLKALSLFLHLHIEG